MEKQKMVKMDVEQHNQPQHNDNQIQQYIKQYKNITGYEILNLFTQQSVEQVKQYEFRNILMQFSQLMAQQCDAEVGFQGSLFCLQTCLSKLALRQKQAIPTVQQSNNPMNPFIQLFASFIQCLNQLVQLAVQFIEIPIEYLSLTQIAAILGQNLFLQQLNIQVDVKHIENLKNSTLTIIKLFNNQKCFDQVIDLTFVLFKIISPLQYGLGNQVGIIGFLKGIKKLGHGTAEFLSNILIQIVSDSYVSSIYSKSILEIQSKFNSITQLEQEFKQSSKQQKSFYNQNEAVEQKTNEKYVQNITNQHGAIIRIINLLYYSELIAEVHLPQSHHIQKLFQSFTYKHFEKYIDDLKNEATCFEFEYFMLQIIVQQLLRGLITQNIYSYVLGKLNNKVMQVYAQYYNLDTQNLGISIFGLFKKMQQLILKMQPFLRHSSNLLSNFKIIEYILINNQNKIGSSQHVHKQIRQLQNYLNSQSPKYNSLQYRDVNVVQMFEMLPINKYILSILPGYKQFSYCLKYFGSQIHKNLKQVYVIGYDNFLYIQISNSLSFTVEVNVKQFIQYNDQLLQQVNQFNNQMSNQNNMQLNAFHQKMFELDRLIFSFHSRDLIFLFGVYAGIIQDLTINNAQFLPIEQYISLVSECLQLREVDVDMINEIASQLIKGAIQLKALIQEKYVGHLFNQYMHFILTAYFNVIFAQNNNQKSQIQRLVNNVIRQCLFDNGVSQEQEILVQTFIQNSNGTVQKLVSFVLDTQFIISYAPSLLYTDSSLQRLNFTCCFPTIAMGISGNDDNNIKQKEEKQNQYFIDERLKVTSKQLQPFFTKNNWQQQTVPKNANTFFFAGHGGGENQLKGELNVNGMVLMGCSSITEVQVNEHLRYQLRHRLSSGKFLIGCLWDVLSGDLDRFSLQFLNMHGPSELDSLLESVRYSRAVCTYQGLTGVAIILYWNECQ